jgi:hypothetical protein
LGVFVAGHIDRMDVSTIVAMDAAHARHEFPAGHTARSLARRPTTHDEQRENVRVCVEHGGPAMRRLTILLHELRDTVGKLGLVDLDRRGLVERQQLRTSRCVGPQAGARAGMVPPPPPLPLALPPAPAPS